jgi:hypothetical protein
VDETIALAKRSGNIPELFDSLKSLRPQVSSDAENEKLYAKAVSVTSDDLARFLNSRDAAIPRLGNKCRSFEWSHSEGEWKV